MNQSLAQALINMDDMVAFLDDGENDKKLVELLTMYDPMGFYADKLLSKYLPKAERTSWIAITISREYHLCSKLAHLAFDRELLERWVVLMLRLDYNPSRWLEGFMRRKLNRSFTPEEAQRSLAVMIKHSNIGTEHSLSGGIVSSEPVAIERVVAFARDHGLDADDALKRIKQHYLDSNQLF